jgi:hypothetical protein
MGINTQFDFVPYRKEICEESCAGKRIMKKSFMPFKPYQKNYKLSHKLSQKDFFGPPEKTPKKVDWILAREVLFICLLLLTSILCFVFQVL